MGAVLYECWIFVAVVAPEMLKFFICSDRTLNVQVSCKMMLKKKWKNRKNLKEQPCPQCLKPWKDLTLCSAMLFMGIKALLPSMPGTVNWCCCVDVLLDIW